MDKENVGINPTKNKSPRLSDSARTIALRERNVNIRDESSSILLKLSQDTAAADKSSAACTTASRLTKNVSFSLKSEARSFSVDAPVSS